MAAQYAYDRHIARQGRDKKRDASPGPNRNETNNYYINDLDSRTKDTNRTAGGEAVPDGYKKDPTR